MTYRYSHAVPAIAAGLLLAFGLVVGMCPATADDVSTATPQASVATDPVLIFEAPSDGEAEEVERLSLSELKQKITTHNLTFADPLYKKEKRYAAFKLHDVLQLGFSQLPDKSGKQWRSDDYSDVAFVALDGYQALGSLAVVQEPGAYLVYEDFDQEGWEPLGKRKTDPGPFYVIWTGAGQGPKGKYPWPYQLQTIRLVQFKQQYPNVFPANVPTDSHIYDGYQLFRKTCFACHAMNRQGGMVGPDLNAPRSITEYRDEKMLRDFIRQPSKFRYTKMPDNPTLTDEDLDDLLAYLRHMATRKGE